MWERPVYRPSARSAHLVPKQISRGFGSYASDVRPKRSDVFTKDQRGEHRGQDEKPRAGPAVPVSD
jgi:hypothetical protein